MRMQLDRQRYFYLAPDRADQRHAIGLGLGPGQPRGAGDPVDVELQRAGTGPFDELGVLDPA